ncbi:MAG: MBOAT family O-acyltransferase [Oscillospiraceae bacterium]
MPAKAKRIWLLAASLFFYGCWRAEYLLLMVFSIAVTFVCGLAIAAVDNSGTDERTKKKRRLAVLIASLAINLAILFFFKYFNFVADLVGSLLRREAVAFLDVALPVGISFYTFQALGYTIDVYRGDIPAERSFIKYAVFVSFFPQLVAGPIERAGRLLPQFDAPMPGFQYENMRDGLILIAWGFFQKLVIADRVAMFVNKAFDDWQNVGGLALLVAAVFFAIQIYCDFASYSNIARGSAQIMGFSLMRNFDSPYFATSLADFWNRWHISLSSWFRDYLYIPLGGNRKGLVRGCINILIIFFASGLWHGANLTFVCWGLLHGVARAVGAATKKFRATLRSRLGLERSLIYKFVQGLFVFAFVVFAFIFFRADSVSQAVGIIRLIFTDFAPRANLFALGLDGADMVVLLASLLTLAAVDAFAHKTDLREKLVALPTAARWSLYLVGIAIIAVFGVYGPAYDAAPFIYFQF